MYETQKDYTDNRISYNTMAILKKIYQKPDLEKFYGIFTQRNMTLTLHRIRMS